MKTLRIVFCILACVCVAASVFLGIFLGWEWFVLAAALAVGFGAGMIFFKERSEPHVPQKDFMDSPKEQPEQHEEKKD